MTHKKHHDHEKPAHEAATPVEPIPAEAAPGCEPAGGEEAVLLKKELDELRDKYQRLGAEYANSQKRIERQLEQERQLAQDSYLKALLPVLDNFEHTVEKGSTLREAEDLLKAVEIVKDHLLNVLSGMGLQKIVVTKGDTFDPGKHEALLHQPTDECPENTVLAELGSGYTLADRTLRAAKVSIAKALPKAAPPSGKEDPGEGAN